MRSSAGRPSAGLLVLLFSTTLSSIVCNQEPGGDMAGMRSKTALVNTVIVPAYKENLNLRPLTERLFKALEQHDMKHNSELLIVDDNSNDGSEDTVKHLQSEGYAVRIVVRKTERGLSSAVLRGMSEGLGSRLVCMDADLQHPPEKVPLLLKALADTDFVIGTRYGEGFDVDPSWPWYRVVISKGARLMARPLTPLSDPMSGMFGISRQALNRGLDSSSISPLGFKIGLELYVKCHCQNHAEVNIFFGKRTHGESKLSGKVMVYYVLHLVALYKYRFPAALPLLLLLCLVMLWQVAGLMFAGSKPKPGAKDA